MTVSGFRCNREVSDLNEPSGMVGFSDKALASLQKAVASQRLSPHAQTVLIRIATDPHGILRDSASAIVAPMIYGTNADADAVLRELYGKQLILEREADNQPRIVAHYATLGISAEAIAQLTSPLVQFEVVGQPHSPTGMSTLRRLFDDPLNIYIPLGITAHNVFDGLDERARAGKKTVFLFPGRKNVPLPLRPHYAEVLKGWVRYLRDGPRYLRTSIHFRIVTVPYRDVYTSALSASSARINLTHLSSSSTRDGTILQVGSDSSLYAMFKGRIQSVFNNSRPLLRIDSGLWCKYALTRAAWPITLAVVGILCAAVTNVYAGVVSSIAIGLLRVWISDTIQVNTWSTRDLFPR